MVFHFKQGDRPLPGYTIQRGVGRGGFGEVYYATSDGGKEIALKYLRENPQIELRGVTHCLNLKSPHLVALHDIKENAEGDFFVVMEYVSGPSLRELMNEEPNGLGVPKAAYLLREIAKGLAYLHDRGIVHRDLKPGNIFYEDGYVKIGDYGLAKIMSASQHSGQTVSVGTVHYMAPEVGSGNYDRTIDIYSMGVILYEMLLGRVPFTGQTMGEVLMKHLTAQPEVDSLPEPFPRVIRKALAKDPKDRFQTVNEMITEVLAAGELDRSVAAFEPASLSTVAARVAERAQLAVAAALPIGAGGGSGQLGTGSSNVGLTPPPVIPQPVTARPAGRLGHWHDRFGVRIDRLADRIDQTRVGREVADVTHRRGHWAERLTIALLVTGGIAFGVSALGANGNLEFAVEAFGCILCLAGGALAGCWFTQQRWRIQGKWLSRVIVTGAVGVCLLIFGAAVEHGYLWNYGRLSGWIRTLLLVALFCDWPGRFREGRAGKVRLGAAFSAGLFAVIVGAILTGGDIGLMLAAVAAAASLAFQSMAGIWPPPGGVPEAPSPGGPTPGNGGFAAGGVRIENATPVVEREADEQGKRPEGAMPPPIPAPVAPTVEQAAATRLPLRSPVVRTLWLLLAAALMCGAVLSFTSIGLVNGLTNADQAVCVIGGIAASAYFLFALSRVPRRYKSGLWRGVLRPGIFFTGLAASGGAGAAMGLLEFAHEEEQLIALAFILGGAVLSLFVWFIPVPPYVPPKASLSPQEPESNRLERGRRLMIGGGTILVLLLVFLAVVLITVPDQDWDEVIPALVFSMTTPAAILLIKGWLMQRPRRLRVAAPKLNLPLRTVFDIQANPNLSRLIERHFTMLGYTLASKADLLWSFARGNWSNQFWQSDIRRWGTKLNVAAYELNDGGYRLTCFLDVDMAFNRPDQRMMSALNEELTDLQTLLDGQDVAPRPEEIKS